MTVMYPEFGDILEALHIVPEGYQWCIFALFALSGIAAYLA